MPMQLNEIEQLIKAALPGCEVAINDLRGDGNHYACHVIAAQFAGKSRVEQHKMVYDAIGARMGGELHALALQTTPKEDGGWMSDDRQRCKNAD